jgi:hypothetical protein
VSTTTQKEQVLLHMRHRGSITPLLALKEYQCFRLAARIEELRRDGWLINSTLVTRRGKRYAAYSLAHVKQGAA